MKKITLIIGLSLLSLAGFAQQSTFNTPDPQEKERQSEYIIVLDDSKLQGDIDLLLNGSDLHGDLLHNEPIHELAHGENDEFNLEGKLVEGAFSYNDYAVRYEAETQVSAVTQ